MFTSFAELVETAKKSQGHIRMAVAAAEDPHTLGAALMARDDGIVSPILIGNREKILEALAELGKSVIDDDIIDAASFADAAAISVRLVREGRAHFILKGFLDTKILLKAVVNRENGLGAGRVMSHFAVFDIPEYKKPVAVVDGGMVPYPDLQQKKAIIENTVLAMRALGCEEPKVGVLACVEKINPKMPETVEADALKQMNLRGEIKHCIVEGPISYDCAMSKEIAALKKFESPCAGDCDILLAPNIHAGNIMGKMLTVTCGAKLAGFIVGAQCPIALTSRGSSTEEKYNSIVLSALCAGAVERMRGEE